MNNCNRDKAMLNKLSTGFSFWIVFILLCYSMSCSKAVKKESVIDTPKDHYLGGIQKLENNDLIAAESDFLRAIELDKKSPYGYTGMALLELERTNYKMALKQVKKALKCDKDFASAYIAKGRIITVRKQGEKWYEEAVNFLEKALQLDPENQRALFFLAECHLEAQQYSKAQRFYTRTLSKEGIFTEKAKQINSLVSKIITAAPISENSGYIALDDKIDRSDLCVLLIDELRIRDLLKQKRPAVFEKMYSKGISTKYWNSNTPPDIKDHQSRKWIYDIIPLHITDLDVFSNGFFYPDKLLTRAQCAMVIQDVIVILTDAPDLSTVFIGTESHFTDVRSDYYAFNAITLCVENGIMKVNPDTGFFDTGNTVSGVDAILMIRALKRIIEEYTEK